jgi:hypothetical protein
MKSMWRRQRKYLIGGLVFAFARSIGLTLRCSVIGKEHTQDLKSGAIYVGWHGKSFIPANYFAGKGLWALFSLSNDGELQSRIFKKFGFQIIRGSTGRGGARALIESIRLLRQGDSMAITPDGPRGPAHVVQPGVITMAMKSGAALIPVGTASRPGTRIGTWDRYLVPWFFAKAAIAFGPPIYVQSNADEAAQEAARKAIQDAIEAVERQAETACGLPHELPFPGSAKGLLEPSERPFPSDDHERTDGLGGAGA